MSQEKGDSGPLLEFVGRVFLLSTGLEKKRATGGDAAEEKKQMKDRNRKQEVAKGECAQRARRRYLEEVASRQTRKR